MNLYQTRLFAAVDLKGPSAGEFRDSQGMDLNDWMEAQVTRGYSLLDLQPVAYATGLYVLATMELVDDDDTDPVGTQTIDG